MIVRRGVIKSIRFLVMREMNGIGAEYDIDAISENIYCSIERLPFFYSGPLKAVFIFLYLLKLTLSVRVYLIVFSNISRFSALSSLRKLVRTLAFLQIEKKPI